MNIVEKVVRLGLLDDQYVVIGSGLLDAWGLRVAGGVDLVVSDEQFDILARDEKFTRGTKGSDRFLVWGDYEVFDNWGEGGSFEALLKDSIVVDGVRFVSPQFLIAWKRARGHEKDTKDIALLEGRLNNE